MSAILRLYHSASLTQALAQHSGTLMLVVFPLCEDTLIFDMYFLNVYIACDITGYAWLT